MVHWSHMQLCMLAIVLLWVHSKKFYYNSGIGESLYYEDREFPSFEEALADVKKPDFLEYYWHDGSEEWYHNSNLLVDFLFV